MAFFSDHSSYTLNISLEALCIVQMNSFWTNLANLPCKEIEFFQAAFHFLSHLWSYKRSTGNHFVAQLLQTVEDQKAGTVELEASCFFVTEFRVGTTFFTFKIIRNNKDNTRKMTQIYDEDCMKQFLLAC